MMRIQSWTIVLMVACGGIALHAQEAAPARPTTRPVRRLTYVPPDRGAPVTRVGSGTRGEGNRLPEVELLAPQQTGVTTMRRPTLYWFLSDPTEIDIVVTITDLRTRETILDRIERGKKPAGMHQIHLEDRGAESTPGHQYRVVVLVDAEKGGDETDPAITAVLRCVEGAASGAMPEDSMERLGMLASKGYWYDAVDALGAAIMAKPGDATLKQLRADLLRQEKLTMAAEWEEKGTPKR